MIRVLVLGRAGQLARALAEAPPQGLELDFAGRDRADLTRPDQLAGLIASARPDVVVNAAAYTAVDRAEREREHAFRINAEAPQAIARACRSAGARLIHLSTDYVFGGEGSAPFDEAGPVAPLQIYGASKAEGERRVLDACPGALVVRTAWLMSARSGFVKAILGRALADEPLSVVGDQRGSPTHADDLAAAILHIVRAGPFEGGILHAAGPEPASWFDLAQAIVQAVGSRSALNAAISPFRSGDAPRPADSRLSVARLKSVHGRALRPWRSWITETAQLGQSRAAIGVETRQQSGG